MAISVEVAEGSLPSGSTSVDVTSSGFGTPKFAVVFADRTTADGTQSSSALMGVALMAVNTVPFENVSIAMLSTNGQGTSIERRSNYYVPVALSGASGVVSQWDGEFITDGVRFTKTSATVDAHVRVVMFSGDGIEEVGSLYGTFLNVVTNPQSITGLGFEPNFMLALSAANTSVNTNINDSIMTLGVAGMHQGTTLRQWSACIGAENGQSSSSDALEHRAANTEGSILKAINPSNGTTIFDVSVDSFDSDGYTYSGGATPTELIYFLPIRIKSTAEIYISDGSIGASATSWTSGAAANAPSFGMIVGIDGAQAKDTVYSAVGALHLTYATSSQHYASSFALDPDNGGGVTWARTLRQKGSWEMISQDRNEWTGSFAFNGSNEMALTSLTNIPARSTHLWYFMLSESSTTTVGYSGANEITKAYSGSTEITAGYSGSTQIF